MSLRCALLLAVLLGAGAAPPVAAASVTDSPTAGVGEVPAAESGTAGVSGPTAGAGTTASIPARAAVTASTASTDATGDGDVHQRKTLALTPDSPGEIRTTVSYDVPSSLRSLEVTLPTQATVRRAEGFERADERQYRWDGATESPTLVFDFAVNRSFGGARAPGGTAASDASSANQSDGAAFGSDASPAMDRRRPGPGRSAASGTSGYSFVDAGPWAIAQVPSLTVGWQYVGPSEVGIRKSVAVDGEGATGGEVAYLGPAETHVREANGQRFRLVVPAAADLRSDPAAVLDALTGASGALAVGARDESVFFVAAPTSVDWGPRGLEYGGSDAWVRADARLDRATNVWLHEYVHTRQAYNATAATAWTTEGIADYYAALLSLEQGRIDFDAFRDHLLRGGRHPYADAVLADPSTWSSGANYLKGALVYGTVDRQIRLAGNRSADAVLARMNADEDRVTRSEFLAVVEAAGDGDVREIGREYTETRAAPDAWTREDHRRAFPAAAPIRYDFDAAGYRATGPFRNQSVSPETTLVTGETLRVRLPVRNVGDSSARYAAVIRRNGSTVARTAGKLGPGASANATLAVPVNATGRYTVIAGESAVVLAVREPASVQVRDLSVSPERVRPGTQATVRVTVANPADRPAAGPVEVSIEGVPIVDRRVTLAPGVSRTLTATVGHTSPGEYALRAGDETATFTVVEPSTSASATTGPGTTDHPLSLSWPTVVAALALAVVLFWRNS